MEEKILLTSIITEDEYGLYNCYAKTFRRT